MSGAAQHHAEAEAGRQRALRESGREDRVQQREVSFVLDRIIRRLERQGQAEERVQRGELFVWSCPAGCGPQAADCGRLIFRRQCMPTADSIRRQQLFILRRDMLDANDGDSGLLGLGDFRSIGGHSFLKTRSGCAGPAPSSGGGRGPCEGEEARVVQQRTMDTTKHERLDR